MRTEQVLSCRSRQDAVDSNEGERAPVPSLIRTDKRALHKAGIRVEFVRRRPAGFGVRSRPAESQVDLPDESFEVCNRRWVTAVRVRTMRVCGCC